MSSFVSRDRAGSVRNLADSSGTVTGTISYDGFGKVLSSSGAVDRFGYTGREYDATTGLQYNRGRYYDAALGRWTQEDKIGFAGRDPNLERYVGNSPTNFSDPSGRGLTSLIYTGQWNPAANVWDAAMEAAGPTYAKSYNDQAASATIVLSAASQVPGGVGVLATVVNVAYVTVLNPSITPYDGPLLATVGPKGRPILIGRPVPRGPRGAACPPSSAPTIVAAKQGKHIPGHKNFIPGRSPLTHPDPQKLVNQFAGKGQPVGTVSRGRPGFKERIDFGEIIGEINGQPTSNGIIHYSKDGVHIVPANP